VTVRFDSWSTTTHINVMFERKSHEVHVPHAFA
jgi:hypothetical protein